MGHRLAVESRLCRGHEELPVLQHLPSVFVAHGFRVQVARCVIEPLDFGFFCGTTRRVAEALLEVRGRDRLVIERDPHARSLLPDLLREWHPVGHDIGSGEARIGVVRIVLRLTIGIAEFLDEFRLVVFEEGGVIA